MRIHLKAGDLAKFSRGTKLPIPFDFSFKYSYGRFGIRSVKRDHILQLFRKNRFNGSFEMRVPLESDPPGPPKADPVFPEENPEPS